MTVHRDPTTQGDPVEVLVVGAGPTGLALAAHLRAFASHVRIVDRQPDRTHESRALAIQPRTLEVLAGLGVTPELLVLAPAAEHVTCRLLPPDGRHETVAARYVVGCDGAHSTVRHLAGIGFEGSAYPQTFLLADLEADGLEPGAAHTYLTGAGMLFFFPLGTPATWRMLAMRPPGDQTPADAEVSLAELQAITASYTTDPLRLRDPVWMTRFRLHLRAATRYQTGRVFLAGDAAHVHSPAGAQGMNTGVQDAVNLAWKLALACSGAA